MRHADFESRKSPHKKRKGDRGGSGAGGGAEENYLIVKILSLLTNCCNVIY